MKVSAVINTKRIHPGQLHSKLPTVFISFIPIALGLIFGSLMFNFSDEGIFDSLKNCFLSFATDFTNKNTPEIISGMLLTYLAYFFMMVIFGMCALGTVPVFILSFFKSAGIGMTAAYIYSGYALKGVEYCLLVFYPGKILAMLAMLMLTHSCYYMSGNIRKLIKGSHDTTIEIEKYVLRSALIGSIFILSSLVDFLMLRCFSSLFAFG